MRSNDFSAGPPQARAEAFFLGMNRYRSPAAMLRQVRRWSAVARALKRHPGYLWHRSYLELPDGIGLMVAFADRDSLLAFARTPEHHEIMKWLVGGGAKAPARGGFIRILGAEEWGYTNGEFRAEDGRTELIEAFTPLSDEEVGGAGAETGDSGTAGPGADGPRTAGPAAGRPAPTAGLSTAAPAGSALPSLRAWAERRLRTRTAGEHGRPGAGGRPSDGQPGDSGRPRAGDRPGDDRQPERGRE
ncbi:antibiotic biosynthesis monooxygenase family protein [Brevibacterium album]|uniref:antibiotic biosynthesis monooxygenase family protein n=1 Tax=Brevibacterium album TaxID=417948 RepID=UPI00041A0299|nr:hypothetical protein [Brevibacterium album]